MIELKRHVPGFSKLIHCIRPYGGELDHRRSLLMMRIKSSRKCTKKAIQLGTEIGKNPKRREGDDGGIRCSLRERKVTIVPDL